MSTSNKPSLVASIILSTTLLASCAAPTAKPTGISAESITPRIASVPHVVASTDPLIRAQLQLITS